MSAQKTSHILRRTKLVSTVRLPLTVRLWNVLSVTVKQYGLHQIMNVSALLKGVSRMQKDNVLLARSLISGMLKLASASDVLLGSKLIQRLRNALAHLNYHFWLGIIHASLARTQTSIARHLNVLSARMKPFGQNRLNHVSVHLRKII